MFNMHIACDTAQVKLVLQLLFNMLQHVLGNSLQCGGVFLLTTCLAQKLNWRLLPKTCCSMFRKSQSIDFVCHITGRAHIKICEIFHGIHVPLNILFKFTGLNFVQLNINPVEFHLIQRCSFCNIYMSNDVKFF